MICNQYQLANEQVHLQCQHLLNLYSGIRSSLEVPLFTGIEADVLNQQLLTAKKMVKKERRRNHWCLRILWNHKC